MMGGAPASGRIRSRAPYHCMSLRSVRLACLLGVALSMALPRAAWSAVCRTGWCDCDDPYRRHGSVRASVKVLRDSASAVVAGTIVRVGPEPGGSPSATTLPSRPAIAWVQVTHRWKGASHDTLRVSLHPPGADVDSAVADTLTPLHRGPHDPKVMAIVYGGWIVLLAAPAAFALLPMEDSGKAEVHANYLSANAGIGYGEHERRGWSHVQSVEAFWNGLFAELRAESYHVPSYSGVQAARAGYLWRRRRTVAGGVTAGYVRGAGDNLPGGLEVGLPLLLQLERGWMRFDATYVLTSEIGYYNWRTVMGLALPRKPFVAGFSVDIRTPIRGEEPFSAPVLFIGTRF